MSDTTTSTAHLAAVGVDDAATRCPIMPTYGPPSVQFVRGEGPYLWDATGKRYIDFLSGLAVTSLGHAHPAVAAAVADQAQRLLHVSNLFASEHAGPVATLIDHLIGGGAPVGGQTFFCNSGAEANEAAIKLARRYGRHGRHTIICAYNSFHGRTLGALAATGQPAKWEGFAPLPEGFRHVVWGDAEELGKTIDSSTVAIMIEPIQGEGGVNPVDPAYVAAISQLCKEHDLLLIFDEVQTGFARTGRWFGFQHFDIQPDIITTAKALGNGMPIGACWAKPEVAAAFKPGDHGTTYGGQPFATAAAKAVIETMISMDAPTVVAERGAKLAKSLRRLPGVTSVRGLGLLLATELEEPVSKIVAADCLHRGLIVNAVTPSAIRLAPPFVISDADIDAAVAILNNAITAATSSERSP